MNTVLWTLIILGILCLTITILWFTYPKSKSFFESLGSLFTLVSSILALTIFLQFYVELEKAKSDNKQKRTEEKAKFNSRMTALGSELVNNIRLCNLYVAEKENNLKGIEVPSILFDYSVMNNMIINGDITSHKLRAELSSLLAQMIALNNLIQTQQQLMIFKNFAPNERQDALKMRTITIMIFFHSKIPLIKNQLIKTEPLFTEFWNEPEKFLDEKYLKENFLPDALIR